MLDHGDHKKVDFSLFLVHFHPPHGSSYVTFINQHVIHYIYIADIMIVGSNCSLLVVGGHVYMTSSESAVTST